MRMRFAGLLIAGGVAGCFASPPVTTPSIVATPVSGEHTMSPPATNAAAAGSSPAAETPIPTTPPAPPVEPFEAVRWEMQALPAPVDHPDFVVTDVSWDGSTFLFRDDDNYDRLYVSTTTGVLQIAPPGDGDGTIWGALRPDGRLGIVSRFDGLWRVDLPSGAIHALPQPPNGGPFSMDLLPDGTILVLAGQVAGPLGGSTETNLWLLDLATERYTRIGRRSDFTSFRPFEGGIVAAADAGGGYLVMKLFELGFDGTERPIFDASGYGWLAVHPRLGYLALSKGNGGEDGAWLVDLETLERMRLLGHGMVVSFSPSGKQIAIQQLGEPDQNGLPELYGPMRVVNLQGEVVETFPNSAMTAWVGIAAP